MGISTLFSQEESSIMEMLSASIFLIYVSYIRSYPKIDQKNYIRYVEKIIQKHMSLSQMYS